jgi:hypothetical protein
VSREWDVVEDRSRVRRRDKVRRVWTHYRNVHGGIGTGSVDGLTKVLL